MTKNNARDEWNSRPGRESLSKRLGKVAEQIAIRDGHCCIYCGATAEKSGAFLHLDHVTPKNHGGSDTADNLVLACIHCNSARQDMTLAQWSHAFGTANGLHGRTIARRVRRRLAESLPKLQRGWSVQAARRRAAIRRAIAA